MAKLRTRTLARKRRHKRVRRKIVGTSERPRLNVFRSNAEIYVQIINDDEGHTIASASSIDSKLKSKLDGLNKSEQANIVGEEIAKRAADQDIKSVVFDRGGFRYMGRIKALADAARENGLVF